jgi:flagellar protein FliO/FliZ
MMADAFIGSLVAVAGALAAVLVAAWLFLALLRRWRDGSARARDAGPPLRFLRAMAVGQRERIALIEVRSDILLIGVTTGGISVLARWPADVPAPEAEPGHAS